MPNPNRILPQSTSASALIFALLGAVPMDSRADVNCVATTNPSTLNAGMIIPWRTETHSATGTISVECTNTSGLDYHVAVCMSIGSGDASTSIFDRRIGLENRPSDSSLSIDLTSNNQFFGSYFHGHSSINAGPVNIPHFASGNYFDVPITLTVKPGQVAVIPGDYIGSYLGSNTAMAVLWWRFIPQNCNSHAPLPANMFGFTVIANVPDFCEFAFDIPDMSFPPTDGISSTRQSANTELAVRCTNTTPYTITLLPSNNNVFGQGEMTAVDALGQVDTVPYALYQDSSGTTAWGGLPDNGLTHVGTGNIQRWTVFGVIPANLNVAPGTYRDNVIVSVSY